MCLNTSCSSFPFSTPAVSKGLPELIQQSWVITRCIKEYRCHFTFFSRILDDIFRGTQGEGDTHWELHPLLHRGLRKPKLKCPLPLLAVGRTIPPSALPELLRESEDLKEKACRHSWSSSWTTFIFVHSFLVQLHRQQTFAFWRGVSKYEPSLSLKTSFFTQSLKKCICNENFGVKNYVWFLA